MLFSLDVLLILLNVYFFYKKKRSIIVDIVTGVYIWIVISGYYEGIDIYAYISDYYRLMYTGESQFDGDIGFYLFQYWFTLQGYSYIVFKQFIVFVAVYFMMNGIRKISTNVHLIYAYYLSYQLVLDTIQFRNFIGFAFFMFAIRYLIEEGKYNKFKYLFLISIATCFHSIMILYSLFVFKDNKYIVSTVFYFSIILALITLLNGFQIPLVQEFFSLGHAGDYLSGSATSSFAFLLPIITIISYYIIVRKIQKNNPDNKLIATVVNMDKIVMFSLPLCISSFQWYRLIRNMNIFHYAVISGNNRKDVLISIWLLFLLAFWIYCDWIRFVTIEGVMTVFENNVYINDISTI